jgi:transcriptional antiterminator NusG
VTEETNQPIDEAALGGEAEAAGEQSRREDVAAPEAESAPPAAETPEAESSEPTPTEEAGVEEVAAPRGPTAAESQAAQAAAPGESEDGAERPPMDWYILKVQSNRENSIAEALQRRVAIAGLEEYFAEIIVPTEKVTEFKGGKKRVVKRKLYPGYIVAHMAINDDTWFLVRETPGIGDFTGAAGKPTPMLPHEVARIVQKAEEKTEEAPKLKINFEAGDRVKINEGTFENFEGEVATIDEASGRISVMINIFGRSTPVELEYWQVETI